MNINNYTGLPYNFRTRNCWHHVRNVRRDAGIDTPEFDVVSPSLANSVFLSGQNENSKGLVRVYNPQNYDAVLLGQRHGGRIVWHSGVYFDGRVSHCEMAAKQVKLESMADIKTRYTEIQFWR